MGLAEKLFEEHDMHPIPVAFEDVHSTASVGKGYLSAMGLTKPLKKWPDFPKRVLGAAATTYYGGRTEIGLRHVKAPIELNDILSSYPTTNANMGIWDLLRAERIECVDATDDVRRLLAEIDLDECFERPTWRQMNAIVEIQPNWDAVPVRAEYMRGHWNLGITELHSRERSCWYALPDLIASKLLTGRTPVVIRAVGFVPVAVQDGLRPVKLRGAVEVDPRERDFFLSVIEARHELPDKDGSLGLFLKILANSTSYGVFFEFNPQEQLSEARQLVYGDGKPFLHETKKPHERGAWCFPPIATLITSGARLLLAMIERCVTDAGGVIVYMDTDGAASLASPEGGQLEYIDHTGVQRSETILPYGRTAEIRERFRSLNPYSGLAGEKSILELEKENFRLGPDGKVTDEREPLWCWAVSSKKYALWNETNGRLQLRKTIDETDPVDTHGGEPGAEIESDEHVIRKLSEHGLGYLIAPAGFKSGDKSWIREIWEWIIRTYAYEEEDVPEPGWFDQIAIRRYAITTPGEMKHFDLLNGQRRRRRLPPIPPHTFMGVATRVSSTLGVPDSAEDGALLVPYGEIDRSDQCERCKACRRRRAHDRCGECEQCQAESDCKEWRCLNPRTHLRAIDRKTGQLVNVIAQPSLEQDMEQDLDPEPGVRVRTYRDIAHEYAFSDEPKMLGPDGELCHETTIGRLRRRQVIPAQP